MNPLAIILAVSVAANVALGYAYLGQRDTAVVATEKTGQATGAAQACSQGVEVMAKLSTKRHADAAPKIEAAQKASELGNQRADEILTAPAAVPGDDCRSAQVRVETWWNERGQK